MLGSLGDTGLMNELLAVQARSWPSWELTGLRPAPEETWGRMREFLDLDADDRAAMLETVEPLLKRAHELVVSNYDTLLADEGAAAVLGWEEGADPAHLAERRRFFTVWIARTLGMDLSDDFARYLFRAGKMHAAHGPRAIHVPELYVTGAISLVHAAFARFLSEEMPGSPVVPSALAGWNKMLSMHLQMMLDGYRAARDVDRGDFAVPVRLFGLVRAAAGRGELPVAVPTGATVADVLRKFFNYYPNVRGLVFEKREEEADQPGGQGKPWVALDRVYAVRNHPAWRVLLNGRNVAHLGGPDVPVSEGDDLRLYSPGR
jgi:molybdopterin converting factor small subunit